MNGLDSVCGCRAVGEVLVEIMSKRADRNLMVFCGHTHSNGFCEVLPNLGVHTGGAEYTRPTVQAVFDIA